MATEYKFDGRYLKDRLGRRVAQVNKDIIKDKLGRKVGSIKGEKILDKLGNRVGQIKGSDLKDRLGRRICKLKEIEKLVEGSDLEIRAALWLLCIRET